MTYALRSLLKSPGFTLVAILTIAIGIGANTALFSTFDTLVLHPLSLPQSDRLVRLWASNTSLGFNAPAMSWPRYEFVRDHQKSFSNISAAAFATFAFSRPGADPEQVNALSVTASFFPTLGVAPIRGRNFTPAEDVAGAPNVALLSYEFWQRAFGGRDTAIGETMMLDGNSYTIVGVLAPALSNPFNTVLVFVPRPFEGVGLTPVQVQNGAGYLGVTARLAPGVSLAQAQAEVKTLAANYCAAFAERLDGKNDTPVVTFADELVGNSKPTFYVLLAAVGLVLLIACANVASLFLGRLSARHKEIAIRLSMGATRGQLVRQFLVESVLFSALAGVLGVFLAWWSLAAIQQLAASVLPTGVKLGLDVRVLAFTVGASALCALFVGLVPALQASRTGTADVLKDHARGSSGGPRSTRFRSGLIVGEVTLSVVLLVSSALLLASFVRLQRTPPGFNPRGLATAFVTIPVARYQTAPEQAEFFAQLLARLEAQPQVRSAAVAIGVPLSGFQPRSPYAIQGRPVPPLPERALANLDVVSEKYFSTMQIPLRAGRTFDAHDNDKAPNVCILSETFAQRLFPGRSAIGQVLLRGRDAEIKCEIVGVVGDVKSLGLNSPPFDDMYFPERQLTRPATVLVVRTDGDPERLQPIIRSTVAALDSNQPIAVFQTMDSLLSQSLGFQRIAAWLTAIFAGVALLLSAVGLYSVLAYTVTQRTSEIGIRMALGAQRAQVISLVLGSGLRLVALGLVLGLAIAAGCSQLMQSLLFEVQPIDPLIYGGVATLFAAIATLACLFPSLRASRIDPLVALRME
ncbi:MAG TPA: ABC transporter permease [Opitutaceae bacterium]|nr:ABC transporter permease [Opitutaceae bacterium]